MKRKNCRLFSQAGFTLVETLVSVVLSALVVVMATQIYGAVLNTKDQWEATPSTWTEQQFMRSQLDNMDMVLTLQYGLPIATEGRLVFISRNSAQYGKQAFPVVAIYQFEEGGLMYAEKRLSVMPGERIRTLTTATPPDFWQKKIFSDIDNGHFLYFISEKKWIPQWTYPHTMPPLVKLVLADKEIIFSTQDLPVFSFSGLSPLPR